MKENIEKRWKRSKQWKETAEKKSDETLGENDKKRLKKVKMLQLHEKNQGRAGNNFRK